MTPKPASILVVDDEEPIRRLLVGFFSRQYECYSAADVDSALELLTARAFDLIITDILMPRSSGLELCGIAQTLYPATPVIVLSAAGEAAYIVESARRGVINYAAKPCDLSYLSKLVAFALSRRISETGIENDAMVALANSCTGGQS